MEAGGVKVQVSDMYAEKGGGSLEGKIGNFGEYQVPMKGGCHSKNEATKEYLIL